MIGGKPSYPQSAPALSRASLDISHCKTSTAQGNLPGFICNDDNLIRDAITSSIRNCVLSREQIADRMTEMLATRVTAKMLDSYSAESRPANRFPAAWLRAFCEAVGSDALVRAIAEAAGCRWISGEEIELLELGRQTVLRKRADQAITEIEDKLRGVEL